MFKNNALKLTLIILIATLCITTIILMFKTNKTPKKDSEKTYTVKIDNDLVYLYENNEKIKQYDIDITVLPGEDIEILIKGISVKSISEADLIAEDYDG